MRGQRRISQADEPRLTNGRTVKRSTTRPYGAEEQWQDNAGRHVPLQW